MSSVIQTPKTKRAAVRKARGAAAKTNGFAGFGLLPAGSNPREDWECWGAHLVARQEPRDLASLLPRGKQFPLLWSMEDEVSSVAWRNGPTAARVSAAEAFLARETSSEPSVAHAIESLAWVHELPKLAAKFPAELWWQLLDRLIESAEQAAGISGADHPLAQQLLAGELPLTLAYLFPELPACRELLAPARDALSRGLGDLLDGEGTPAARSLPLLRPLLATWTRCGHLGREFPEGCFSDTARAEFDFLLRHALRLTRRDGRQALTPGTSGKWSGELFAAALALRNEWEDAQIADCVLPGRTTKRTEAARRELPAPPTHSEWAESAVLRYDWHRGSDFLAITFHDRVVSSELNCGGDLLWSGRSNPHVSVDGRALAPASNWEVVCWHTDDDDVVYLELEMTLDTGWRVQRQLLLAGQDRFLLACDSVLGGHTANIDYRCALPLSPTTRFELADDTREGLLIAGPRRRLVLPLALPEWQAERSAGSLAVTAEGLTLSQSAHATGLFAPLFFDLDPRRARLQRTWRRLTVAEQLCIVPPHVAAAYRVQIGPKQWLAYRSFRQPSNRSVLGQNTASECLVARFSRKGEIKELLEIE